MIGSPFAGKEKAILRKKEYEFTKRILPTDESASQEEIRWTKFGRTHLLDIQGILSYPEIIGACCAITANMLVIRKFPGLEPGVGAVREPPLRMLAVGATLPPRGRGKSIDALWAAG